MFSEDEQFKLSMILKKITSDEMAILQEYFRKTMNPQANSRSSFTSEEDEKLKEMVAKYGESNWNDISRHFPGRTTRQCRERYRHYLNPMIKNGEWTREEDELLLEKYEEFGSKWVQIAKFFNSRTDINVKNRWIVLMRKRANSSSPTSQPQLVEVSSPPKPRKAFFLNQQPPVPSSQPTLYEMKSNPYSDIHSTIFDQSDFIDLSLEIL